MRSFTWIGLVTGALLPAGPVRAQPVIIDSELATAYHFVDHYEILIDAPAEVVWPQLLDLRAWMEGFDYTLVAGTPHTEGAVMRLYESQDFLVEIVKIIPQKLLVLVNLPSVMQGEESTGLAMLTLTDVDGKTLVASFMSRQYYWPLAEPNPFRARRESAEYQEFNRAGWEERMLPRLRALVEGQP